MQNQKKIILNDETDYGECFACGPKNPYGLKLKFIEEKNTVKTTFKCTKEYQGFPGYTHGGIITTIIDEVMSRVSVGTIAAEGKGMFAILNENSLKEMSKDYPSLSKNWMY